MTFQHLLTTSIERFFLDPIWVIPIIIFLSIELFFAKNKKNSAQVMLIDLIVNFVNTSAVYILGYVLGYAIYIHFSIKKITLPFETSNSLLALSAQILFAILLLDIHTTIWHYIKHKISLLWKIHYFHHNWPLYTALAASRANPIDKLYQVITASILFAFFINSLEVYALAGVIMRLQAGLTHANINLSYGWFDRIIASPNYHRIHHLVSSEHYNKNYCVVFPFIDKLLNAQLLPENYSGPITLGIENEPIFDLEKEGFLHKAKFLLNIFLLKRNSQKESL